MIEDPKPHDAAEQPEEACDDDPWAHVLQDENGEPLDFGGGDFLEIGNSCVFEDSQ